jgi:hypothetical protein
MKVAKLVWVLVTVALYLSTLALYANSPVNSDADVLLIYGMLVLSAPLGLFVLLIIAAFLLHADGLALSWYASNTIIWLTLVTSGYVQWFILIPKIWPRLSTRFRKQH